MDDRLDLFMSEFTESDVKIMAAIVDSYYSTSSGASISVKANVDLSQVGGTLSSALKQAGRVKKKVFGLRMKARKKAGAALRKGLKIADAQLTFISGENAQLRKELSDVRNELSKCLAGEGKLAMTEDTKKIAIESSMKQVDQVVEESAQIDQLIVETREELASAVEEASSAVIEGDKAAVDVINGAIDDQRDIQKIQSEMEESGDIPSAISAVPMAPVAPGQPGYTKPQRWRTSDGDEIKISPEQAASADEVQEDLQDTKGDLFASLREEVARRRRVISGNEDEDAEAEISAAGDILNRVLEMQINAGYHMTSPAAKVPEIRRASADSEVLGKTTRRRNQPYFRSSPLRKAPVEKEETDRKTTTVISKTKIKVSKASARRRSAVPLVRRKRRPAMHKSENRKPMNSSASLMSTLDDSEETRTEDTLAYEVPDAYSTARAREREEQRKPSRLIEVSSEGSSEEEDDDDLFF